MSVLSPNAENIEIAGIAEWAIKATGDTGYVVFPFLRHGIVMFEALYSENTELQPEPYAYQFNASAEFLPVKTLINNTNLLSSLGALQIEHRIKLMDGQYIMSGPLNSTPSPTGFGTKWKFCSDNEFEDACYIELEASRRLLPAEFLQVTTSTNVDTTASISSDTFYAFNNFSKADVIPSGVSTFHLGTDETYGDLVEYVRGTKFEAELLSAEDDRGQFVGNMVKVDFECEPMETVESQLQAWNTIAQRINYAQLSFNGGLTATLGTELGFTYGYVSVSDMQDIAHGKIVASGIVTIAEFVGLFLQDSYQHLVTVFFDTLTGGSDWYCAFNGEKSSSGSWRTTDDNRFTVLQPFTVLGLAATSFNFPIVNMYAEILKNGISTGIKVSLVNSSFGSDTTDSIQFNIGDEFSLHIHGTSGSISQLIFSALIRYRDIKTYQHFISSLEAFTSGDMYCGFSGVDSQTGWDTSDTYRMPVLYPFALSQLTIRCNSISSVSMYAEVFKNGMATTMKVSVSGTGGITTVSDSSDSVSFSIGDELSLHLHKDSGVASQMVVSALATYDGKLVQHLTATYPALVAGNRFIPFAQQNIGGYDNGFSILQACTLSLFTYRAFSASSGSDGFIQLLQNGHGEQYDANPPLNFAEINPSTLTSPAIAQDSVNVCHFALHDQVSIYLRGNRTPQSLLTITGLLTY